MESSVRLAEPVFREESPRVQLLIADDDDAVRTLLVSHLADAAESISVLEAEDGAEAIRIGLQRRPEIALLDVNIPRIGGLEVAVTLRELRPEMRLALQTAEPLVYRERADDLSLPLFDKLQLERAVAWVQRQAQEHGSGPIVARHSRRKATLRCSSCGYGITTLTPPERCPMCHEPATWTHTPWRPFT